MDYSLKGILVLLQDLQRIHFGKVSVYVDVIITDGDEPIVACCVFDRSGEPHTFNFYAYEKNEQRKETFLKVKKIIEDFFSFL